MWSHQFSSVQFSRSVMSDYLWPRELQHTRPPYPWPWYISPSICVIFGFFHQCFIVFIYRSFISLGSFIPKYFILFVAMVSGIVSLISLSVFSLFSSVQFSHSVISDSLRPHKLQHTRPPCPSPAPRVYPNSHPLSRWCHPAISSSVVPFSSCDKCKWKL